MIQHVLKGWCPPLVLLRRLGFRTAAEINRERMALKILRGDFARMEPSGQCATSSLISAIEE